MSKRVMISETAQRAFDWLKNELKNARGVHLEAHPEHFELRYHQTKVAVVKYDGDRVESCVLDSGGWRTPTTKSRLNLVMEGVFPHPAPKVFQTGGKWFIRHGESIVDYDDRLNIATLFGTLD